MDTVADALIRIKNSYMAYKSSALLPYSKLVKSICEVLKNEGFIESFEEASLKEGSKVKVLRVALKYQDRKPVINGIKRMIIPILITSIIITDIIDSIGIRNEKLPSNTVKVIDIVPKIITKIH